MLVRASTLNPQTERKRLWSAHRKQKPSANSEEDLIGSAKEIMIKRCLLYILEHGSVPAVALALAIAPTNSRSRQRDDLTEPTKPVTKIVLSERREDSMTLVTKDCEPGGEVDEPTFGLRFNQDTDAGRPPLFIERPSWYPQ
jgi:hypothetical protein